MDNGWYHARITWCITIFIADFFFSFFLLRSTSPTSWRACFPSSSPPRYADRPIAALDQGRIYFTSFSPRFYVRTTIEFIRESVEFQSSSVPDPISRSIIHIYIYRFVFRNRILLSTKYSPIYLIFTFYSRIDDLEKFRGEGGSLSIIYYLARVIG